MIPSLRSRLRLGTDREKTFWKNFDCIHICINSICNDTLIPNKGSEIINGNLSKGSSCE